MIHITVNDLKESFACSPQISLFKEVFLKGADVTYPNCVKAIDGDLDILTFFQIDLINKLNINYDHPLSLEIDRIIDSYADKKDISFFIFRTKDNRKELVKILMLCLWNKKYL